MKDPMTVILDEMDALLDDERIDLPTYNDLRTRFCRQSTRSLLIATADEHRELVLSWARDLGAIWAGAQ